jgi:hypothetical protein
MLSNGLALVQTSPFTRPAARNARRGKVRGQVEKVASLIQRRRKDLAAWEELRGKCLQAYHAQSAAFERDIERYATQWIVALDRLSEQHFWTNLEHEFICVSILEEIEDLPPEVLHQPEVAAVVHRKQDLLRRLLGQDEPAEVVQGALPGWDVGRDESAQACADSPAKNPVVELDAVAARRIFRSLAGAMHPDREQDPARRARKTDLMQQLIRARTDGDLEALLALQGVVQTEFPESMRDASAELAHLEPALQSQAQVLRDRVVAAQRDLKAMFGRRISGRPGQIRPDHVVASQVALAQARAKAKAVRARQLADPTHLLRVVKAQARQYEFEDRF